MPALRRFDAGDGSGGGGSGVSGAPGLKAGKALGMLPATRWLRGYAGSRRLPLAASGPLLGRMKSSL